jgi:hypothetical protein
VPVEEVGRLYRVTGFEVRSRGATATTRYLIGGSKLLLGAQACSATVVAGLVLGPLASQAICSLFTWIQKSC